MQIRKAFIPAGGSGTRMSNYMEANQVPSKSLIQIEGRYLIQRVVGQIRPVVDEILLSVDRVDTLNMLSHVFWADKKIYITTNNDKGAACYPMCFITEPFFFIYGHAPAPTSHLQEMQKVFNGKNIVVTGFGKSSRHRSIVVQTDGNKVVCKKVVHGEYFPKQGELILEPPAILPPYIAKRIEDVCPNGEGSLGKLITTLPNNKISVVTANFPAEMNYEHELTTVEKYITETRSV